MRKVHHHTGCIQKFCNYNVTYFWASSLATRRVYLKSCFFCNKAWKSCHDFLMTATHHLSELIKALAADRQLLRRMLDECINGCSLRHYKCTAITMTSRFIPYLLLTGRQCAGWEVNRVLGDSVLNHCKKILRRNSLFWGMLHCCWNNNTRELQKISALSYVYF